MPPAWRAEEAGGRRCVRAVIVSGAEDTAAPPDTLCDPMGASRMSRAGTCYRAAGGAATRNLGQGVARFTTTDGIKFLPCTGDTPFR